MTEEGGKCGVLEEMQLRGEKEMSREGRGGQEETPNGKQRVLSDRLGLCNRMGAF